MRRVLSYGGGLDSFAILVRALELFPNENVTRSETGIHAWGRDAAADYIRALHAAAPKEG